MHPPGDPGPRPASPVLSAREAIRTGVRALRGRFPMLLAVAAIVALAHVPAHLLQSSAASTLEGVAGRAEARGDRPPGPDEALEDLQAMLPACCATCASLVAGVFVSAPLAAGAMVAGARAVRGNGRVSDAFAGFRGGRYLPTLGAAVVSLLVGGGATVLVAALQSVSVVVAASRAIGPVLPPGMVTAASVALGLVTLWLSARLWFALTRAADPERPAVGAMSAIGRSWQWTEGAVQWQVLLAVLALGAATAVLLAPGAAVAGRGGGWAFAGGAILAAGAAVAVTAWMAVLGAAYESVADANEPRDPAAAAVAAPEGGMSG